MTVASDVFAVAKANPLRVALEFPDRSFTTLNLAALATSFAARMEADGVTCGSIVELHGGDDLMRLATALATAILGALFVVRDDLAVPSPFPTTHHLSADPSRVDTDHDGGTSIRIDASWAPSPGTPFATMSEPNAPDALWLIALTGWTLSHPLALGLSQRAVAQRCASTLGVGPDTPHTVAALPGIGSTMRLLKALETVLSGRTWIASPAPRMQIDTLIGTAADLMRWPHDSTSRAPIAAEILSRSVTAIAPAPLIDRFSSVRVTVCPFETGPVRSELATGREVPGQITDHWLDQIDLLVLDPSGQHVAADHTGLARLRTPYMAQELGEGSPAPEQKLKADSVALGRAVRRSETGKVMIGTSTDYLLAENGQVVDASELEDVCRQGHGIEDAIAFLNPKQDAAPEFFVFLKTREGKNRLQAIASAKYLINERVGASAVPRVVQIVGDIPRRPDRHPDRAECARLILALGQRGRDDPRSPTRTS